MSSVYECRHGQIAYEWVLIFVAVVCGLLCLLYALMFAKVFVQARNNLLLTMIVLLMCSNVCDVIYAYSYRQN